MTQPVWNAGGRLSACRETDKHSNYKVCRQAYEAPTSREQLAAIAGCTMEELPGIDLRLSARDYLTRCQMTQDQIARLVSVLTEP